MPRPPDILRRQSTYARARVSAPQLPPHRVEQVRLSVKLCKLEAGVSAFRAPRLTMTLAHRPPVQAHSSQQSGGGSSGCQLTPLLIRFST